MEQIKINDRLLTAVPFVRSGKRFCDVGTDHAYLPIYLFMQGKISSAIAADINVGPLEKADENIKKYELNNEIKTVLCDGLTKIEANTVDDIAIFGMGGELIVKIIDDAPWLRDEGKRLILQPMTHPEKLRKYLLQNGFNIIGETLSLDRGKIYQTICAEFDGVVRDSSDFELNFGRYILSDGGELLRELMQNQAKKLERKIIGKRSGKEDFSTEQELLNSIKEYIER